MKLSSKTKVAISQLWNFPSRVGDKYKIDWLTYNPGVFLEFAMVARRNAPLFVDAVLRTFPTAMRFNDIGCGTGQFVAEFKRRGRMCEGFEYSRTAKRFGKLLGVQIGDFDLNNLDSLPGIKKADVSFSLEVGEHIPLDLCPRYVEQIAASADTVVFTAAPPGQTGHGHINCQPKSFWADLFATFGFAREDALQNTLEENLRQHPRLSPFLLDNVQVFVRSA